MTPTEHKAASEALLLENRIPVNKNLPLVESSKDVHLRSRDELLKRLIALWAVVGAAILKDKRHFGAYINSRNYQSWLSKRESSFLLTNSLREKERIQFSWRLESLYFLSWCGGLIKGIKIPTEQSSVEQIMDLFPQEMEEPSRLREAIQIREKEEIISWADLLYRLHWAVRQSEYSEKKEFPLEREVIQEWHHAVNWMTCYESEDDWDMVGTDT
ncbi:DUF4272 domain-containing protein [Nitrospira lenta]|uniref:DUF4272 domain-containing protein n=1 Tax=Nitrospira lenta TaxID=1436998 RepID=A0A330L7Q3_9BACT|nr:DUF4272 domain-containing protein [Nitrospira lenta]SPP65702.1 conserved hypothetical protein [Nitrospira lenta]